MAPLGHPGKLESIKAPSPARHSPGWQRHRLSLLTKLDSLLAPVWFSWGSKSLAVEKLSLERAGF